MTDGERDSAPGPAPDGDGPGEEAEAPDAMLVTRTTGNAAPPVTPPDASRTDEFPRRGRSERA
ncbi:hypothetical protein NC658_19035 [Streptomyces griseoincarnatus]|uniref:Uncharacterized protein n=1 Tax=Streptomyces griseoincarnatus TaxID=29305 RepID=A0ABT0VZL4_STRGI|nr:MULTISPECIES: hypothetical protein [Streptomyces]MCM2515333.1 hypothetical protein [Streptomyces griseoincarnatus]